jgi:hypothetical protein
VRRFDKSKSMAKENGRRSALIKLMIYFINGLFHFESIKGSNRKKKSPRADRAILLGWERAFAVLKIG